MIYIYPYGGFGKCVGEILEIFGLKYDFIDDNIENHKLSDVKFAADDLVLIGVSSNYENFKNNLNKFSVKTENGIFYCANLIYQNRDIEVKEIMDKDCKVINAIDKFYSKFSFHYNEIWEKPIYETRKYLGEKLNNYYKPMIKDDVWGGIYHAGKATEKHLYKIPQILSKNMGKKILHIYNYKNENPNAIFIHYRLLEFIDFLPNILTNYSGIMPNVKTKVFCLEHIYAHPFVYLLYSSIEDFAKYFKEHKISYFFSSCKKNYKIEQVLDNQNCKVIKAGYPSLDKNIAQYNDTKYSKDYILIAARPDEYLYKFMEAMIQRLIQLGFKVIFRPHPLDKFTVDKEQNLIIDYSPSMIESMQRSFTCISNHSSVAHTFALTTLRKTILVLPDELMNKTHQGESFYDENLHIKATNIDEIIDAAKFLKQKVNDKFEQEKIKKYRKEQVFNLGHSSEFIANFIMKHSKG